MRLYSEFLLANVYIWIKKTLKTIQKFLSAESWKKGYIKMFKKFQKAPTSLPFVSNSVTWQPWNLTRSWFEVETLSRKDRQSKPLVEIMYILMNKDQTFEGKIQKPRRLRPGCLMAYLELEFLASKLKLDR